MGQTPGGLVGPCGRHAEAFEIDKAAYALGPRARIHAGDIAAHAVADQVDGPIGRNLLQQHVQVGQVVGEVVAVAGLGAAAQAEAAPVVSKDAAALHKGVAEGVDHKLVGGGHIHPAMGQHQHGQLGIDSRNWLGLPASLVVVHIAHGQHLRAPLAARLIGRDIGELAGQRGVVRCHIVSVVLIIAALAAWPVVRGTAVSAKTRSLP